MALRVTQAPVEVLHKGQSKLRVTQAPIEVLTKRTPNLRLTNLAVEVLRQVAPGVEASASSQITFSYATDLAGVADVDGSGGVSLDIAADVAGIGHWGAGDAETTLEFDDYADCGVDTPLFIDVSASSSMAFALSCEIDRGSQNTFLVSWGSKNQQGDVWLSQVRVLGSTLAVRLYNKVPYRPVPGYPNYSVGLSPSFISLNDTFTSWEYKGFSFIVTLWFVIRNAVDLAVPWQFDIEVTCNGVDAVKTLRSVDGYPIDTLLSMEFPFDINSPAWALGAVEPPSPGSNMYIGLNLKGLWPSSRIVIDFVALEARNQI